MIVTQSIDYTIKRKKTKKQQEINKEKRRKKLFEHKRCTTRSFDMYVTFFCFFFTVPFTIIDQQVSTRTVLCSITAMMVKFKRVEYMSTVFFLSSHWSPTLSSCCCTVCCRHSAFFQLTPRARRERDSSTFFSSSRLRPFWLYVTTYYKYIYL